MAPSTFLKAVHGQIFGIPKAYLKCILCDFGIQNENQVPHTGSCGDFNAWVCRSKTGRPSFSSVPVVTPRKSISQRYGTGQIYVSLPFPDRLEIIATLNRRTPAGPAQGQKC